MRRRALVLAALALLPPAAAAAELRGRVQLVGKGGKPAQGSDLRQAVVSFRPAAAPAAAPAPAPLEMVTRKKEFVPRVLAVTAGSRVRFPNQDPILHNVFSVTPEQAFDLGLYPRGAGKEQRFAEPGVVRVFCNVHHAMVGYVVVLDTPFRVHPDALGNFALSGLPAGPGRLTVWHEQVEPWTVEVDLPHPGAIAARLEVTRPRLPAHLNKLGKPYGGRDRYRD